MVRGWVYNLILSMSQRKTLFFCQCKKNFSFNMLIFIQFWFSTWGTNRGYCPTNNCEELDNLNLGGIMILLHCGTIYNQAYMQPFVAHTYNVHFTLYSECPKTEHPKSVKRWKPNFWQFGFQHVSISDVRALAFIPNLSEIWTCLEFKISGYKS